MYSRTEPCQFPAVSVLRVAQAFLGEVLPLLRLSKSWDQPYDQNPYATVHVPTIIHALINDVALASAVRIDKSAFGTTTWSTVAMGWKHCHKCADVSHLSLAGPQQSRSSSATGQ